MPSRSESVVHSSIRAKFVDGSLRQTRELFLSVAGQRGVIIEGLEE